MPPFSLRTSRSCIDRELVAVTCPLVILMGVWDVSVCLTMLGYVLKSGVDNSIKDVGDMREIYIHNHINSLPHSHYSWKPMFSFRKVQTNFVEG